MDDDFFIYSAGGEPGTADDDDVQGDNAAGVSEPLHVTLERLYHGNKPLPGT
jgi:hypothetical protein